MLILRWSHWRSRVTSRMHHLSGLPGVTAWIVKGFFRGVPASMLRVHILRTIRSSGAVRPAEHDILIPFPNATIVAAGSTYCTRAPGKLVPTINDRLLVFGYLPGA